MQIFACALNTQTITRNLNITYLAKTKGPPLHGEGFAVLCARRRTFRLRAMGALSQVKVLNMPR